jgi:hypothetical protein
MALQPLMPHLHRFLTSILAAIQLVLDDRHVGIISGLDPRRHLSTLESHGESRMVSSGGENATRSRRRESGEVNWTMFQNPSWQISLS